MKKIITAGIYFYVGYCVALLCAVIILVLSPKTSSLLWVNGHYNPFLDKFFLVYTNFGDGLFYLVVCIILFWRNRRHALTGIISFAFSSLLAQFIKQVIFPGEPRPRAVVGDQLIHFVEGVTVHMANSFPSGHTVTAFSIATLITYFSTNAFVQILLLLFAILVAYSRMYLAQHFLIDVTVGSVIGVVSTWGVIIAVEGWRKKRGRGIRSKT